MMCLEGHSFQAWERATGAHGQMGPRLRTASDTGCILEGRGCHSTLSL